MKAVSLGLGLLASLLLAGCSAAPGGRTVNHAVLDAPGGSVIGLNGRNAAMAALADGGAQEPTNRR